MKKKHFFQIAGGLLISAIGLLVFFKSVDIPVLWKEVRNTKIWIVVGVALLCPLTILFRALRLKQMLPEKENGGDKKGLFSITMIGFMVNNILPARIGEAVRALMLWKRNRFTVAESIGSLLLERGLDVIVFSAFFFIPVFVKNSLSMLRPYAFVFAAFFIIALLCLFIYSRFPQWATLAGAALMKFLPNSIKGVLTKTGTELISNLQWIFSLRKTVMITIYSVLLMFGYAFMFYLLGWGIESFDIYDSMFGVAVSAVGAAIPLSPGYIGTMHSSLLQGLSMLGVVENKAGAMAVLYHAIGYVTITLLGLICLVNMKMTFKDINKAKDELNKQ